MKNYVQKRCSKSLIENNNITFGKKKKVKILMQKYNKTYVDFFVLFQQLLGKTFLNIIVLSKTDTILEFVLL